VLVLPKYEIQTFLLKKYSQPSFGKSQSTYIYETPFTLLSILNISQTEISDEAEKEDVEDQQTRAESNRILVVAFVGTDCLASGNASFRRYLLGCTRQFQAIQFVQRDTNKCILDVTQSVRKFPAGIGIQLLWRCEEASVQTTNLEKHTQNHGTQVNRNAHTRHCTSKDIKKLEYIFVNLIEVHLLWQVLWQQRCQVS